MSRYLQPLVARFWAIAGAVSIRTKILGIVLSLMLLLGVGVTLQVRSALRRSMQVQLQAESLSIGRDVASRATDPILINDLYGLYRLLQDTLANHADLRYVFILDGKHQLVSHTFGDGFPRGLIEANECADCGSYQAVPVRTTEGVVWDTAVPILDGRAGFARVGLSESSLEEALATVTTQLLVTTVLVSIVGIAAAGFLTWILMRPILSLVRATEAVGHGELNQRVEKWADDEIGALAEAFNEMIAKLTQAEQARAEHDRLRAQLLEGVISAQEDERKRIARELHDETGQALTTLMLGLRTLMEAWSEPVAKAQAAELRSVAARTLDDVHNLARELRPSVLDDLGLAAALERYVSEYELRSHLPVDLAIRGLRSRRLPAAVEIALYRIVQEGLTNIARHAEANSASVLIEMHNGSIRAIIEDDGRGFDPKRVLASTERFGLYGMQERIQLLGGTFTIESRPGRGTSLYVKIATSDEEAPSTGSADNSHA
ncbi:MAG: HAMP domain-containing protein [Anaerolineales bacterium]